MTKSAFMLGAACCSYAAALAFLAAAFFQKDRVVWIALSSTFTGLGTLHISLYARMRKEET